MASNGFGKESKGINQIPGKFYPLQHNEVVEAKNLTKSQLLVLYYLRTLDPYSNGIQIKASKIAQELEISKRSVYGAIQELVSRDLICLEDVEYSIKIEPKGCLCATSDTTTNTTNTTNIENSAPRTSEQNYASEIPSSKGFQKPKKNNKEFKKDSDFEKFKESLSEEEKESFIKFGLDKASQLPNPPTLKNKWIEKNWEAIREEWLLSNNKPSSSESDKWENHPQRDEWLEIINTKGWANFIIINNEIDEKRNEFLVWAKKKGLSK